MGHFVSGVPCLLPEVATSLSLSSSLYQSQLDTRLSTLKTPDSPKVELQQSNHRPVLGAIPNDLI